MLKKTQTFNDGQVSIYRVDNVADAGDMPKELISVKRTLRYKERTVGLTRFYEALQANVRVSYVLRCLRNRDVSTQDVAIPNDGKQYKIVQIQYPEDSYPPVMDMTLEELTEHYDIFPVEYEGYVPLEVDDGDGDDLYFIVKSTINEGEG